LLGEIVEGNWKKNKREFGGGKMGVVMILEDHM
jgi:hypothetical protein